MRQIFSGCVFLGNRNDEVCWHLYRLIFVQPLRWFSAKVNPKGWAFVLIQDLFWYINDILRRPLMAFMCFKIYSMCAISITFPKQSTKEFLFSKEIWPWVNEQDFFTKLKVLSFFALFCQKEEIFRHKSWKITSYRSKFATPSSVGGSSKKIGR